MEGRAAPDCRDVTGHESVGRGLDDKRCRKTVQSQVRLWEAGREQNGGESSGLEERWCTENLSGSGT